MFDLHYESFVVDPSLRSHGSGARRMRERVPVALPAPPPLARKKGAADDSDSDQTADDAPVPAKHPARTSRAPVATAPKGKAKVATAAAASAAVVAVVRGAPKRGPGRQPTGRKRVLAPSSSSDSSAASDEEEPGSAVAVLPHPADAATLAAMKRAGPVMGRLSLAAKSLVTDFPLSERLFDAVPPAERAPSAAHAFASRAVAGP